MKLTIKNREIELKYGFRAQMIYERINGSTFQLKGLSEIVLMLYSCILASDKDIVLTFDEYIEIIDENPSIIYDFTQWLRELFNIDKFINQHEEEGQKGEAPKKE